MSTSNVKSKPIRENGQYLMVVESRDFGTKPPGINLSSTLQKTGQVTNFSMLSFL